MNNLYDHQAEGRLDVGGRYEDPNYYLRSTAYRFLALSSLSRAFEADAIYIDVRIAETSDLDFVKFVKAFRWLMTDLDLIEGLDYEPWEGRDHFYNDRFRGICDSFRANDDLLSLAEFELRAPTDQDLREVLMFFDGLRADEPRLRWDRLVALHLFVMAFLNAFGYDMQRSDEADLGRAAAQLRNPEIGANVERAVPKLGLSENAEAQRVVAAVAGRKAEPASSERQAHSLAGASEHHV
jgi:hypothetical protein